MNSTVAGQAQSLALGSIVLAVILLVLAFFISKAQRSYNRGVIRREIKKQTGYVVSEDEIHQLSLAAASAVVKGGRYSTIETPLADSRRLSVRIVPGGFWGEKLEYKLDESVSTS